MAISLQKHYLRSRLLSARTIISSLEAKEAAVCAARNALYVLQHFPPVFTIGLYAPFRDELDCFVLSTSLRNSGYTLALPTITRSSTKPYPMVFRVWDEGCSLDVGYAGIQEPSHTAPIVYPDVVIVPLVGFDKRGYRLGYGQGFYDRTIPLLRKEKKCCFYGYAYAMQEVDYVPHEAHDIPLDGVITERDVFLFK